ncbi:phenylalanine--tRNA ligase subunit beta [Chondromyces apiculatus]|uniref:Phenylalanine--tRNA ligase beta subunit n=1 Tax=Chondromyces apiculatus DSM 436 TaxID=1192034 RepID=A0A017T2V7_9BACT|nr:phenylalanine--tRNA ligase subunit beta [Chondromyces apiculatus]EYF03538.1 Phenylalanyl-tRNA synthetase beta chain [Chondromyces apiculatus DSM 436]
MKASYAWISSLVPGLDVEPQELAERFTQAGLEVEALAEFGAGTADVVVAQVRKVEPHPSRPKLRLVTVDRGHGVEQRLVCGAPNVPDPGGLVALAPLGAKVPALGGALTAREIGGVRSEGMLCSEMELGLTGSAKKKEGQADPGILVLPPGTSAPGTPLRTALTGCHDVIFEIGLTPNRPDGLGHIGLAREAAALFGVPFEVPRPGPPARILDGEAITRHVSVAVQDPERCPWYGAAMVAEVTIGPSPSWVRYRLESLGIRSISNVVDITNLLLLEFGHPTHAFDLDRVRGSRIVVRRARAGETLQTLDGISRKLDADDLVIADGEAAVALAGVMGGGESEIHDATRRVLLECAYFAPRGVRRASRRHGLHTEASHRFERGVNIEDTPHVLARGVELLTRLGGGAAVPGVLLEGPGPGPRRSIRLRSERMNQLLGTRVPFNEALQILTRLGCTPHLQEPTLHSAAAPRSPYAEVLAPPHRPDLSLEADLIEEVIRVRGLDTLPSTLPVMRPQLPRTTGHLETRVRHVAAELGLSEAITYGFVAPRDIEALGLPADGLRLLNPLSEERSMMRTTLLPGLLEVLRRSRRRGVPDVRMFTAASRIIPAPKASGGSGLPDEIPSFAAVLAGFRRPPLAPPVPLDIYDAKGVAVELLERVTRRNAEVAHQAAEERSPYLHPRGAGQLSIDGKIVGAFGLLHPDVIEALDLGGPAFVVEVDLRVLEGIGIRTPRYRGIPMLPAATRDIALVVPDEFGSGVVSKAIHEAAGDLCESVTIFDLYRGENIPANHRSLAFHVVYRDPLATTDPDRARTLTDEEVDARHRDVVKVVNDRFGAVLRG